MQRGVSFFSWVGLCLSGVVLCFCSSCNAFALSPFTPLGMGCLLEKDRLLFYLDFLFFVPVTCIFKTCSSICDFSQDRVPRSVQGACFFGEEVTDGFHRELSIDRKNCGFGTSSLRNLLRTLFALLRLLILLVF